MPSVTRARAAVLRPRWRAAAAFIAPFVVALVLYGGALIALQPSPTGDEPHYALEAISLVRDGDRDLANQYADPQLLRQVFGSTALAPHGIRYPSDPDRVISVHSVGLPLILAPAAALSDSMTWMRWEMVLIAALAALLTMRLLVRLPWPSAPLRWAVWLAIAASAPLVIGSGQVLGEVPAMVLVLGAVLLLTRPSPSPAALAGAATAAAALPWLNMRFAPLTAALALAALLFALRAPRRGPALAAVLLPLALSGGLLLLGFWHWYGSISPTAQYQLHDRTRTWSGAYRFGPGLLLSPSEGLLPQVPVALLALVGIGVAIRRLGWPALLGAAAAFVYLAMIAASGIGYNGTTFAGRLPLVLLPLAVVPLLALTATARGWRWPLAALGALSLALSVHAVADKAVFSAATGEPGTAIGRYEAVWPDYTVAEQPIEQIWSPAQARAGVGRVVHDGALAAGEDTAVAAPAGAAGAVERVRTGVLPKRGYAAAVVVRADSPSSRPALVASVRAADGLLLGEWRLTGAQAPPGDGYRALFMPFALRRAGPVTIEVRTTGAVALRASAIQLVNAAGSSQAAVGGFPDVPKTVVWVVALLAAALAAVAYDRKAGRISRS